MMFFLVSIFNQMDYKRHVSFYNLLLRVSFKAAEYLSKAVRL